MTVEQYLGRDHAADYKNEFFHERILAVTGESLAHAEIGGNLYYTLRKQLDGANCRVLISGVRVEVVPRVHYAYPAASVVIEPVRLGLDESLANPSVVFEVLSPESETFDRGAKFRSYQTMPSLREYFLVSQDKPLVERFERAPGGKWTLSYHEGLDATVPLACAPCELPLRDIYDSIVFE